MEFRFASDAEAARRRLEESDSIVDVTHGRVPGSWVATLEGGTLPETIASLVHDGAELTGIHRVDEDLDSIYRRYFESAEVEKVEEIKV